LYRASTFSGENTELKKKLDSVDAAINALSEENRILIEMLYKNKQSAEDIAKLVCLSRSGVYYRAETILKELAFMVG
jgi:DNA-directed RNA polymerase specialized sigma subunit